MTTALKDNPASPQPASVDSTDFPITFTLDTVPVRQTVRLVRFSHPMGAFRQKLLAMGLTPGVELMVVRIAPLGDPIQVFVRGAVVSLRKADCQQLTVVPVIKSSDHE